MASSFGQKKVASDTARTNTPDTKITEGASGVRRSIGYKFSSLFYGHGSRAMAYSGAIILQPAKVTWIYVDNIDVSGEDQTNWYSTWDKTTGATARGSINIVEQAGKDVNSL